jgi:EAL domain-containing protein (putative c-di-GMP-specific phosphodiesterase class I)/GGDEF domain-containing protein
MPARSRPLSQQRRPLGLAARAMLFTAATMSASAAIAALALAALAATAWSWIAFGLGLAVAIALACWSARRLALPLQMVVAYALQLVREKHVLPLKLRTGGAAELLAEALNTLNARLEAATRRAREVAFIDPATQLPNQSGFQHEVDARLMAPASKRVALVAVFELRRWAQLAQQEPSSAQRLLRTLAERFAVAVRAAAIEAGEGEFLAARLGVNEFAACLFAPGSAAHGRRFLERVIAALNQPLEWRGHLWSPAARAGGAFAPHHGGDSETLIRRARLAAGAAELAPTRARVFSATLDRETSAKLTLERELRSGIERGEFCAYFQPKLNFHSGRIEACEALARWTRPDQTIVGPGRFIPVAEESGMIGPLADAILRDACWKAAAWARAGHSIKVAVNISALQFRNEDFAANVLRTVSSAGLSPHCLELEITESAIMEDPERTARAIAPLREAGIGLAIDDFGCGHSSLSALSKLPFDVIKIDQQFVRALRHGDGHAAAIIDMILALARTLGMEVVAEGVEERAEADFMAARGCQWGQGFLYGAAVPAREFAAMLHRQAASAAA